MSTTDDIAPDRAEPAAESGAEPAAAAGADPTTAADGVERIALHRAIAVIKPGSIAVRQSRAALLGPLIQALLAGGAVWLIATFMNDLPLWLLGVLLVFALIFGPTAVLGVVYNVLGSSFLVERHKQSARWQQGFLGLGIGTHELVPFWRIQRIEAVSDEEQALSGGDVQDVVRWEVRLVKDNDRVLEIASVLAARPLARLGAERANRLAEAVAEMAGAEVRLAPLPEPPPGEADEPGGEPADEDAEPRRRYRRLG